ncbi:hypothetical protein [Brevibacterium sediminis]|uniref:Asparagine synthetase domain-containing protein n=1 Tax=Brevibacterium sediminis TaxID=1857024 RepID=A0A5C4WXR9_9MICO|nr:hypothetical protein [Brevibacterium sediminis]TNM52971.1 hypothetical protein FHQ09_16945 [Brevibacterium sediminis]
MCSVATLYPRGFIAHHQSLETSGWEGPPERFEHLSFGDLSIWFDSERTPAIARSEGASVLVVGTAALVPPGSDQAEATADLQAIAETLQVELTSNQGQFLDALDYLGGRYAIIVEVDGLYRVFHDAHGTRTIYYDEIRQAFSTHVHLLASLVGAEPRDSDELKAARSWAALPLSFAWDETPYSTIRALLPNHVLELESKRTFRYFPRERNRFTSLSFEERATEINRLWLGQISAFAQSTDRFFVSLSGGLDSRVVLAALREHKDRVDAFTYFTNNGTGNWAQAMQLDRDLSRQVLALAHVNHVPIVHGEGARFTEDDKAIADKNSLVEHGRWLVARYVENFGNNTGLHFRGNTQETIRSYYGSTKHRDPIDLVKGLMSSRLKSVNLGEEEIFEYQAKLDETLKQFGYPNALHDFVASDMFYWEVRMGRWLAEIYNETDPAFDSISPMNMRAIVELGLAGPEDERRSGIMFTELIDRNWPELNFPGINNRNNLYKQNTVLRKSLTDAKLQAAAAPPWTGRAGDNHDHPLSAGPLSMESNDYTVDCPRGEIKIPAEELGVGAFARRVVTWSDESSGVLTFSLRSNYVNSRGTDYMRFEVEVNGETLVAHKIGFDSDTSYWAVYGLHPGDRVSLGVRSLRTVTTASWSRASRCFITILESATEYWERRGALDLGYATTSAAAIPGESLRG